jgi:hypothetical protein
MDPALRRQLIEEFTPEIERLGTLIDRDLSSWTELPSATSPETARKADPALSAPSPAK